MNTLTPAALPAQGLLPVVCPCCRHELGKETAAGFRDGRTIVHLPARLRCPRCRESNHFRPRLTPQPG